MAIKRLTGLDDDNFGFDELVATLATVHIERMSNEHIWMHVSHGRRTVTLNFHIKKRSIWVNVEDANG